MSKEEKKKEVKAKRKLNLSGKDDEPNKKSAKRQMPSTAVQITEYSTRQRTTIGNKQSNSLQNGKDKVAIQPKAGEKAQKKIRNDNISSQSSEGSNNNAIPALAGTSRAENPNRGAKRKSGEGMSKSASKKTTTPKTKNKGNNQLSQITDSQMTDDDSEGSEGGELIHPDNGYEGVKLRIDASEDDFTDSDSDESVKVKTPPPRRNSDTEEIPPEVIEKLKSNPAMQQFINDIVQTQVQSHLGEMEKKNNDGIKLDGKRDDTGKLTTGKKVNKDDGRDLICKPPSDTTIYRPALRKGVAE